MSIGVLLITHPGVGSALLATAEKTLGLCPLQTRCMDVPVDSEKEAMLLQAAEHLAVLDSGEGVLVLTDAYGATPSNIACDLTDTVRAAVVAGLNLPMLIRIFNYPEEDLETLCNKAAEGGIRGIHVLAPRTVVEKAG